MNELINGSGYSYTYNGKAYQYSSNCIAKLDQTLLMYDRNNIIVNAILLWQPDQNPHSFGYPGANASIGAYHGWNVVSKEGIGQLEMKLMQILRGITQVTSLRRIMHTFIPI